MVDQSDFEQVTGFDKSYLEIITAKKSAYDIKDMVKLLNIVSSEFIKLKDFMKTVKKVHEEFPSARKLVATHLKHISFFKRLGFQREISKVFHHFKKVYTDYFEILSLLRHQRTALESSNFEEFKKYYLKQLSIYVELNSEDSKQIEDIYSRVRALPVWSNKFKLPRLDFFPRTVVLRPALLLLVIMTLAASSVHAQDQTAKGYFFDKIFERVVTENTPTDVYEASFGNKAMAQYSVIFNGGEVYVDDSGMDTLLNSNGDDINFNFKDHNAFKHLLHAKDSKLKFIPDKQGRVHVFEITKSDPGISGFKKMNPGDLWPTGQFYVSLDHSSQWIRVLSSQEVNEASKIIFTMMYGK